MYKSKSVIVDGIEVIKNGYILLPKNLGVNLLADSNDVMLVSMIKKYDMSLKVDDVKQLITAPVYCLPRKMDVINFVVKSADEAMDSIEETEIDTEMDLECIRIRIMQRRDSFIEWFDKHYDEREIVTDILRFMENEKHFDKAATNYYANKGIGNKIKREAIEMLALIYDNTKFDLSECYKKQIHMFETETIK